MLASGIIGMVPAYLTSTVRSEALGVGAMSWATSAGGHKRESTTNGFNNFINGIDFHRRLACPVALQN